MQYTHRYVHTAIVAAGSYAHWVTRKKGFIHRLVRMLDFSGEQRC